MLQFLQVFSIIFHHDARAANLRSIKQHLVDVGEVGGFSHIMLQSILVILDTVTEIYLVEADICLIVFTSSSFREWEKCALCHCREYVGSHVALGACADGPRALGIFLLLEIPNRVAVSDLLKELALAKDFGFQTFDWPDLQKFDSKEMFMFLRSLSVLIFSMGSMTYSPPTAEKMRSAVHALQGIKSVTRRWTRHVEMPEACLPGLGPPRLSHQSPRAHRPV